MRTRDLILEEALKLFSEKGIKETTVRDIAKAVGITEGAIYRHFRSKDQAGATKAIGNFTQKGCGNRLVRSMERSQSLEEKFKDAVTSFLLFAFKNPEAFRYMNIFHYLRGSEVRKFKKIPFSLLRDLVSEMHGKGVLGVDPEYALAVITGTLERVFLYKSMGIIRGRRNEIARKTADLLWRSLVECRKS
ncbi:MAG: helix-turn-helix domain-containing protein [Aquificota bacterium]|nr:helix-turn-helix domain-containing protein [Aquificota bacterium]